MTLQSTALLPFYACFLYFCTPTEQNLKRKTGRQTWYPSAKEASPFRPFAQSARTLFPDGTISVSVSQHTWKHLCDCVLCALCVSPTQEQNSWFVDLSGELKLANKIGFQAFFCFFLIKPQNLFRFRYIPYGRKPSKSDFSRRKHTTQLWQLQLSGLGFVASVWLN